MERKVKKVDREYYIASNVKNGIHTPMFLWEPIFKENFWISYDIPKEELLKSAKQQKAYDVTISDTAYGKTFCMHNKNNEHKTIKWIWVSRHNVPALAHECIHAVTDLLVDRGLELDLNSSETYAYMVEWLMNETLEDYAERKKVQRAKAKRRASRGKNNIGKNKKAEDGE